jgi:hypothetical protein
MDMDIATLQQKVKKWNDGNFPEKPSYFALIKVMEELGELAGHYIGRTEHRIGKKVVDHQAGIEDGVADVVIALCVFCVRERIDLSTMVERAWGEVSQRTFIVKPVDGEHSS